MNEEEVLLRGFMGNKYTKFMNKRFSVPAFFFGGLYYIYRKMYKIGFIFYAITTFLNIFLSKLTSNYFLILILHLFVSVVYAAEFGPLYRKFANNQIAKIKGEHPNEPDKVLDICQSKGGTNFGFVVLAIIAGGICTSLFTPKSNSTTISTNNNSSIISNQNSSVNPEYQGILLTKSNINLDEYVTIKIPPIFSEGFLHNSSSYSYEYDTNGGFFDKCKISLEVVEYYTDSKKLIDSMAKYLNATNSLKTETVNNITWSTFNKTDSIGTSYYCAATHDGMVFFFEYAIGEDVSGKTNDYLHFYTDVLNSIKFK